MALFNVPKRPGREQDLAIAKKTKTQVNRYTPKTNKVEFQFFL